ncbi:MAG: hypothetical protein COA65_02255 [Rhodospirillaceae bacterium]|nr:MAG: hypothetical protein COA65_02255 [Rhodospirillaceae bacterium]
MILYRKDLQRIYELRDELQCPESKNSYFHNFENSISNKPINLKALKDIEAELQVLLPVAWDHFRKKVAPLFKKRDSDRDWQPAFNELNEAKAYKYLHGLGYTDLEFIPESSKGKTPDLRGKLGSKTMLCEVKTINCSEAELEIRRGGSVRHGIQVDLPDEFLNKLSRTLEAAKKQMICYSKSNNSDEKIAYVIINFDDLLHEYVGRYSRQLRPFKDAKETKLGIKIIFDCKPAFYCATA